MVIFKGLFWRFFGDFGFLDNLDITDITIISGYKAEILEEMIYSEFPRINIINSVDYQNTNNMYSSYLAKDIMKNEEFLMMNADVFFDFLIILLL